MLLVAVRYSYDILAEPALTGDCRVGYDEFGSEKKIGYHNSVVQFSFRYYQTNSLTM